MVEGWKRNTQALEAMWKAKIIALTTPLLLVAAAYISYRNDSCVSSTRSAIF